MSTRRIRVKRRWQILFTLACLACYFATIFIIWQWVWPPFLRHGEPMGWQAGASDENILGFQLGFEERCLIYLSGVGVLALVFYLAFCVICKLWESYSIRVWVAKQLYKSLLALFLEIVLTLWWRFFVPGISIPGQLTTFILGLLTLISLCIFSHSIWDILSNRKKNSADNQVFIAPPKEQEAKGGKKTALRKSKRGKQKRIDGEMKIVTLVNRASRKLLITVIVQTFVALGVLVSAFFGNSPLDILLTVLPDSLGFLSGIFKSFNTAMAEIGTLFVLRTGLDYLVALTPLLAFVLLLLLMKYNAPASVANPHSVKGAKFYTMQDVREELQA